MWVSAPHYWRRSSGRNGKVAQGSCDQSDCQTRWQRQVGHYRTRSKYSYSSPSNNNSYTEKEHNKLKSLHKGANTFRATNQSTYDTIKLNSLNQHPNRQKTKSNAAIQVTAQQIFEADYAKGQDYHSQLEAWGSSGVGLVPKVKLGHIVRLLFENHNSLCLFASNKK